MANVNLVVLVGNCTRDPELRYTPGGAAVCEVGLAVNRTWKDQAGQKQEETMFVDLTFWGKVAEVVSQYMSKGKPMYVQGRLQLDTWQAQDGTKRSKHRVVAESFQFIGPADGGGGGQQGGGQQAPRQQGGATTRGGSPAAGQTRGGSAGTVRGGEPPAGQTRGGQPQRQPQMPQNDDDLDLSDVPF